MPKRLWTARRIQAFGGFALACSIMLPAINTCGRNWVPACELADTLTHSTSPLEWVGDFAIFGAPYLLGAMVALAALGRTTPERALGKVMGVGAWILIMGCMGLLVGAWISEKAWASGWPPPLQLPFVFIPVYALAFGVRAIVRRCTLPLAMRWLTAVCCIVWFGNFVLDCLYGVYVSLLASLTIAIGVWGEARVRSRLDALPALFALLAGRLELVELDGSACDHCGYALHGLREARCPECGTPFEADRLDSADTAVGR